MPVQGLIDVRDDGGSRRAGRDAYDDVVEGAVHVERLGERLPTHPEHSGTAVVGEQLSSTQEVDELRRDRDPDDREPLVAAVDHRVERVSRPETVRIGEWLADDRLVASLREAATPEVQAVERGLGIVRQRDETPGARVAVAGHAQIGVVDHPALHRGDARDRGDLAGDCSRAFQRREDVAEAMRVVVRVAGAPQGRDGRTGHHERRDAGGHDEHDRQQRRPVKPDVPRCLSVENLHERALTHHDIVDGDARCGLRRSDERRPPDMVRTRSAIPR